MPDRGTVEADSPDRAVSHLPSVRGDALRSVTRVAAVMDTAIMSGPARQLLALATELRKHDVQIHVVLFQRHGRPAPPLAAALHSAALPYCVIPERGPFDLTPVRALFDELRARDVHLVQTHGYRPTVLFTLSRLRFGLDLPWVAFAHGRTAENLKMRLYHALDYLLMRAADRVVVMSERDKQEWRGARDRVQVIYNAATGSLEDGDLPSAVRTMVTAMPRPRIGVIGRLSFEKGVDLFIEAMVDLRHRGVTCSAIVAGDGPERTALERSVHRHGLDGQVIFVGAVSPVAPLYRLLDAVVLPSRSEGLPNVLLEAVQLDVPFLATRVGAIPEVVDATGAGILVRAGDPRALAEGIEALLTQLTDGALREGRRRAAASLSLDRRARAHLELYQAVLRDQPTPAQRDAAAQPWSRR